VVVLAAVVKPGESLDLGDVNLVRASHVHGVVVAENDSPVSGVEVLVQVVGTAPWRAMLPERSVDTNAGGEFDVEVAAPAEPCEIVVSAPDRPTTPQRFEPRSDAPLRVVIGRDRTFRGRAADLGKGRWLARMLGARDEVYAVAPVVDDGAFEAIVPLPPRAVEFVDSRLFVDTHLFVDSHQFVDSLRWRERGGKPVRRTTVRADWSEGAVFEVPK
jgi:hypothetical protein